MAVVKIADILTPDVWNEYGAERTAELSALWQSGIVANVEGVTLPNGGGTVNLPFFQDLTGDAENLGDSVALTPGNIGTAKDMAAVVGRGRAWGANDLASVFSGSDPAKAIMDLIAQYWARQMQKELMNVLNGSMFAATMASNVHDISALTGGNEIISADKIVDAFYKLGDAADRVTAIAMHSAVMAKLVKDDIIAFIKPSDAGALIPTYLGKRVIVDDSMPVDTGVYTTYIFAEGAIGFAEGVIGPQDLETDRDILAGDTVFTMRRRFILHPRGIKWGGTPAGDFPSRAELGTVGNWTRVYEPKNIRIVAFKHKIA